MIVRSVTIRQRRASWRRPAALSHQRARATPHRHRRRSTAPPPRRLATRSHRRHIAPHCLTTPPPDPSLTREPENGQLWLAERTHNRAWCRRHGWTSCGCRCLCWRVEAHLMMDADLTGPVALRAIHSAFAPPVAQHFALLFQQCHTK